MKHILNSLFLPFTFLLCSTISFAQPKTPIVNKPLHSNNDNIPCAGVIEVEIELTNLELFAPFGVGSIDFLPSGYPEMFIELNYFGQTTYIPVTELTFSHGNLISVWSFVYTHYYDLCNECVDGGVTDNSISLKIVTPVNNGYELYPICNYTSENDIFSCLYFHQLSCVPGSDCQLGGMGEVFGGNFNICTNPPGHPIEIDKGEGASNGSWDKDFDSKGNTNLSNEIFQVNASPNPFIDLVQISSNKDINRASLYDINGRILFQNNYNNTDDYNIQLNTLEIPSGIFFIKIESEGEIEMIKMIK